MIETRKETIGWRSINAVMGGTSRHPVFIHPALYPALHNRLSVTVMMISLGSYKARYIYIVHPYKRVVGPLNLNSFVLLFHFVYPICRRLHLCFRPHSLNYSRSTILSCWQVSRGYCKAVRNLTMFHRDECCCRT